MRFVPGRPTPGVTQGNEMARQKRISQAIYYPMQPPIGSEFLINDGLNRVQLWEPGLNVSSSLLVKNRCDRLHNVGAPFVAAAPDLSTHNER